MLTTRFADSANVKNEGAQFDETPLEILCRTVVAVIHELRKSESDPGFQADDLDAARGWICMLATFINSPFEVCEEGMQHCEYCGDSADLPYRCNYCNGQYCPGHRLPESHECDGVEFLSASQGWFLNKETGAVVSSSAEFRQPEPVDPEYTVGTTPPPAYESSPEVEIRSDTGGRDNSDVGFLSRIIRRLLGR